LSTQAFIPILSSLKFTFASKQTIDSLVCDNVMLLSKQDKMQHCGL